MALQPLRGGGQKSPKSAHGPFWRFFHGETKLPRKNILHGSYSAPCIVLGKNLKPTVGVLFEEKIAFQNVRYASVKWHADCVIFF
jgi:hypothetical protein